MSEDSKGGRLKLRNCTGVPVIDLIGDLNDGAVKALETAIRSLVAAGHYNIVVNLKKTASANLRALRALNKTVSQVRSHYGSVDLVAEAGQIRELLHLGSLAGMFRLSASEAQAICKIKKLLRFPDEPGTGTSAHLTE